MAFLAKCCLSFCRLFDYLSLSRSVCFLFLLQSSFYSSLYILSASVRAKLFCCFLLWNYLSDSPILWVFETIFEEHFYCKCSSWRIHVKTHIPFILVYVKVPQHKNTVSSTEKKVIKFLEVFRNTPTIPPPTHTLQ